MALIVLLAFLAVPVIEIGVFIQVGGSIGLWPTLGLIVITAVVGTFLLRSQGLATLARARASLARHELPVNEVFDGACLLIAGVLLLTPGFVTDALGTLLLLPPFRHLIRGPIVRRIFKNVVWQDPSSPFSGQSGPGNAPNGGPNGTPTLEGEFQDLTDDEKPGR